MRQMVSVNYDSIGPDLSIVQRQAITCSNADYVSIGI